LTTFKIDHGFVTGLNTLEFRVRNTGPGHTGLRVDYLKGGAVRRPALPAPRLVIQPRAQYGFVGDTVKFIVLADGARPLHYQWMNSTVPLPGRTNNELVLPVTASDAGLYSVTVSNSFGTASSDIACLKVFVALPGVFDTGTGEDRHPLPGNSVDPHYQLTSNLEDLFSTAALVVNTNAEIYTQGWWEPPSGRSKWIGPTPNAVGREGEYVYRTTFDLGAHDPDGVLLEGRWFADNEGSELLINGRNTQFTHQNSNWPYTHVVITNGFKSGRNTLDFVILNFGPPANGTGLRFENVRLGAAAR
jgi:hypothetical protein